VPFWLDALKAADASPRIVMPIRSPLEVAQSLREVHGIPLVKGALIWLRHVLDAEAQTRTLRRSIFTWDRFLSDWRGVAEKIASDTALSWPRLSDRAAEEIEGFISKALVHNRVEHAALISHPTIHEWVITAYEALLELARNPFSNSAVERLNEVRQAFDKACSVFGPVLASYEIRIEQSAELVAAIRDDQSRLTSRLAAVDAELGSTRADRDRVTEGLAAADAELGSTRADRDRIAEELAEIRDDRDRLAAALRHGEEKLHHGEEKLKDAAIRSEQLQADLNAARERLNASSTELRSRTAELAASRAEHQQAAAASADREAELIERVNQATAQFTTAQRAHDEIAVAAESLRGQFALAEAGLAKIKSQSLLGMLSRPLKSGVAERQLLKSGLFDANWYVREYPDVAKSGRSPARHYLEEGYLLGYRPNPLFDSRWYLQRYEDVRRAGINPLLHYASHGYREGRDPGPEFDSGFYLSTYPDVRAVRINPLLHYLRQGKAEGRLARRR
jgi:predicted  nucleic acid-binding Zn-ribbon protein